MGGVEKLSASSMKTEEWTDRGLKGKIDVKEDGLFYTSVLYTEGFKAYVDGKEVEITPVADSFIAFELTKGEHEIELEFFTPGLNLGVCVTLCGVVLFLLLCFVSRTRAKKKVFCDGCEAETAAEEIRDETETDAEELSENTQDESQ